MHMQANTQQAGRQALSKHILSPLKGALFTEGAKVSVVPRWAIIEHQDTLKHDNVMG